MDLDKVRVAVNTILFAQNDKALQAEGWAHLCGVSQAAVLLANVRGLDADQCAAAGLLHDIYTYRTGAEASHALHGAREAGELLRACGCGQGDIEAITGMILRHSDKLSVGTPLDECLKDADVLAHWLYDREKKFDEARRARLMKVLGELGLKGNVQEE